MTNATKTALALYATAALLELGAIWAWDHRLALSGAVVGFAAYLATFYAIAVGKPR